MKTVAELHAKADELAAKLKTEMGEDGCFFLVVMHPDNNAGVGNACVRCSLVPKHVAMLQRILRAQAIALTSVLSGSTDGSDISGLEAELVACLTPKGVPDDS